MPIPESLQGQLSIPVICAPLFIISTPELVIAQCKAGMLGSFPALNAGRSKSSMSGSRALKASWPQPALPIRTHASRPMRSTRSCTTRTPGCGTTSMPACGTARR